MITIIKEFTADFSPVVRYAVAAVLVLIVIAAGAVAYEVLAHGAPEFRY